jgi:hypothetical protein
VWEAAAHGVNVFGPAFFSSWLYLQCDEQGTLHGVTAWESIDGVGGHDESAGEVVSAHQEEVLGKIDLQTGEVVMVERAETGQWTGKLSPDGTSLKLTLVQSPPSNPVVGFATFHKTFAEVPPEITMPVWMKPTP